MGKKATDPSAPDGVPGWGDRNPIWSKSFFRRSAALNLPCFRQRLLLGCWAVFSFPPARQILVLGRVELYTVPTLAEIDAAEKGGAKDN
ncbi:MAG: hypothetical protein HYY23_13745 [Verrucomicrobia bacterium]|nr:hypothetical protein [Verrucomicrobiota bacterium]